jgi:hypothetical protein
MHCPACQADTPPDAPRCPGCGAALAAARPSAGRSRRPVPEDSDTPFVELGAGANRMARLSYYLALAGLVPGLGLLLGPAAAVLGALAYRRGRVDPEFTAHGPARGALFLGLLLALTNWAGLLLMVLGW